MRNLFHRLVEDSRNGLFNGNLSQLKNPPLWSACVLLQGEPEAARRRRKRLAKHDRSSSVTC